MCIRDSILKDTIYLLVNPLPNPVAEATPNPICQGGNLQLSVNGNNNFTFAWSGPNGFTSALKNPVINGITPCLLYTSDAADDLLCVDLGGRRLIQKKKHTQISLISVSNYTNNHTRQH